MAGAVGVIGVGTMGRGMARNLLRAGFPVVAYDVRAEAVGALVAEGAQAAASPAEVAAAADTVVVMVMTFAQLEAAVIGPDGLASVARPGLVVIGCSTIAPAQAQSLGKALAGRGIGYIDAPVSGGQGGAEAGTLTIMVGADPDLLAARRPVLAALSANLYHCGPVGAGQLAKLCNQIVAGTALVATAECLALAAASGLDPRLVHDIVARGTGDGWMFRHKGARMLAGDFAPSGRLDIWLKDFGIALEAAEAQRLPLLVTAAARQWVLLGVAEGRGAEDDAAVVRAMERLTGRPIATD